MNYFVMIAQIKNINTGLSDEGYILIRIYTWSGSLADNDLQSLAGAEMDGSVYRQICDAVDEKSLKLFSDFAVRKT